MSARRAGVALAAALVAGCELVAGLDGDRTVAEGAGGASTTTGVGGSGGATTTAPADAAVEAGPGCKLATYPSPPEKQGLGGSTEFVVAMRSVDLGDTENTVGLDLDGKCTGEGDGPSCLHPAWMAKDIDDSDDGRDAQSAVLFKQFSLATGGRIGSTGFTAGAEGGKWSMLLRVRGYDGALDDDQIEVAIFPSAGLHDDVRPPKWDGTDAWPVPPSCLRDGASLDQPKYVDAKAYVSGGKLVASLPESEFYMAGAGTCMPVRFVAGFLTATIQTSSQGFTLTDGVIAARWKIADLFASVSMLRSDDKPICTGGDLYKPVKNLICQNADIYSGIATPTTVCDSISVGLGFTASPATIGVVEPLPSEPVGCPPETDPANDHCP
jgi:hypothetical protein